MEGYLGQIILYAGNRIPANWYTCKGQTLTITEYGPLYSTIGTTYGGDGRTTFKLPDLQCRIPLSAGRNKKSSITYTLGDASGKITATLTTENLPTHTHGLTVCNEQATEYCPEDAMLGILGDSYSFYCNVPAESTTKQFTMASQSVMPAGDGTSYELTEPSLGLHFLICISGQYPPRT